MTTTTAASVSSRRLPLVALAVALLGASACTDPAAPARTPADASASLTPIYGGPTLYMPAFPQIVGGKRHTCALRSDYVVLCWGRNEYGQLGLGGEYPSQQLTSNTPAQVVGGVLFKQIAAGLEHTCGLDRDGKAYCWGGPGYGEIGDGSATPRPSPTLVSGGLTFKAITAGRRHSCGLTTDGAAYCWGFEEFGQLGTGIAHYTYKFTPAPVLADGETFKAISAGYDHTCALTTYGNAMCWGRGGTLGNGSSALSSRPVYVGGGLTFSTLDAGAFHTCATTSSGAGYCWGYNGLGPLGSSAGSPSLLPARVGAPSDLFHSINAGEYHSCGIRRFPNPTVVDTTRNVLCWGSGGSGQLGNGTTLGGPTLRSVATDSAGGVGFRNLGLGGDHSCGITKAGRAYCWGRAAEGQLGITYALQIDHPFPRAVAGNHDFSW